MGLTNFQFGVYSGQAGSWVYAQFTQPVTIPPSGNIQFDATQSNSFRIDPLTQNATLLPPINLQDGMTFDIIIRQDSTGGRTLTLDPIFRQALGAPFSGLSSTPNAVDRMSFKYWAAEGFVEYVIAKAIA
jgi:hypothetical protein